MTNEEAIKLLSQIRDALLASNSWLPSTHNPIKECFGMAIAALRAQENRQLASNSPKVDSDFGDLISGKRTEKRTETHACDYIERQVAIDAVRKLYIQSPKINNDIVYDMAIDQAHDVLVSLPSAQPEIIRCGQCKYAEVADKEDAQDGYTCQFHRGSIWFSGSYCSWAERRTDESD